MKRISLFILSMFVATAAFAQGRAAPAARAGTGFIGAGTTTVTTTSGDGYIGTGGGYVTTTGGNNGYIGDGVSGGTTVKPTCVTDYTVKMCMDDLTKCANNGVTLPHGISDLYDEAVRTEIYANMNLCRTQVDKCIAEVRIMAGGKCEFVYENAGDVWDDFDARVRVPNYYSFILHKTGLTPNQAENTCWLLDKNTYGPSYAGVANDGTVTNEYNRNVNSYNDLADIQKANPQGPTVNNGNPGVDGQRGYYARWDAATGECLVRVAAYRDGHQITNDWFWGAQGGTDRAEEWVAAGSAFKCDKNLFGMKLMRNTQSMAVTAIGTGTAVGAGIGLAASHGSHAFDCASYDDRDQLGDFLDNNPVIARDLGAAAADIRNDEAACSAIYSTYLSSGCGNMSVTINSSNQYVITSAGTTQTGGSAATTIYTGNKVCAIGLFRDGVSGNRLASTATGAGIGAGVGALTTAITAFVEKNQIECRVGDGLSKVAIDKTGNIDGLRDFYVKWNLKLPDTVAAADTAIIDCPTWATACEKITGATECRDAQISFRPATAKTATTVTKACKYAFGKCAPNQVAERSNGLFCKMTR